MTDYMIWHLCVGIPVLTVYACSVSPPQAALAALLVNSRDIDVAAARGTSFGIYHHPSTTGSAIRQTGAEIICIVNASVPRNRAGQSPSVLSASPREA